MITLLKSWEFILDIFFPPICLNCKKYLEEKEKPDLICENCFRGIPIYKNLFHPASPAGKPLPRFTLAAAAPYENKTVRELIHYFKYKSFMQAQKPLGEILITYLTNLNLNLKEFTIVPIPLHASRKRKRGFNQAEILADIISRYFNIPVRTDVLKRIKDTKSQIETKSRKERAENLKGSFEISAGGKEIMKNKNIILVDDVYTSGATMNAAIKTIRRYNKNRIIGIVVAKT